MCHLSLRHNDSVMKPPQTPAPSGLEFHTNDNKREREREKGQLSPRFILPCSNYCHLHLFFGKRGGPDDSTLITPRVGERLPSVPEGFIISAYVPQT